MDNTELKLLVKGVKLCYLEAETKYEKFYFSF